MPTLAMMLTRSLWILLAYLCLNLSSAYCSNYDPVALYLTWQRSPESTMTVCWITSFERHDDLVEYQCKGESTWRSAVGSHAPLPGNTPYLIHKAELTNLLPDTIYLFRTGKDAATYKFQTMPAVLTREIHFVVGGDMYHDTVEILSATNRQAARTGPDFALVGGDIAYAADKITAFLPRWTQPLIDNLVGQKFDRWLTWLIAWKNDMVTPDGRLIPMLPVLGNHDTSGRFGQTPAQAPFFYSLFPMPGPQGYNVLDFGNYMSIVLLDSGHTHPVGGQQAWWLSTALEQRRHVAHKFAIYHVPAYPSVRPFNDEVSVQIRKYWVPSFDKYLLTAAFEHHDHDYKRTYPLIDGKVNPAGVVYIGDGAWGMEKPRHINNFSQKGYLYKTAPSRHFLLVSIQSDRRSIAAITPEGDLLDQVSW